MNEWTVEVIADVGDLNDQQIETLTTALPGFATVLHDTEKGIAHIRQLGPAADAWTAVEAVRDGLAKAAEMLGGRADVLNVVVHPAERSELRLDVVGLAEIGAMAGQDRRWAWRVMNAAAAPAPIAETASGGRLYLRTDAQMFLEQRTGKPGRPPAS